MPGLDAIEGPDGLGPVFRVVDAAATPLPAGIVDGWWEAVGPGGVARDQLSRAAAEVTSDVLDDLVSR